MWSADEVKKKGGSGREMSSTNVIYLSLITLARSRNVDAPSRPVRATRSRIYHDLRVLHLAISRYSQNKQRARLLLNGRKEGV